MIDTQELDRLHEKMADEQKRTAHVLTAAKGNTGWFERVIAFDTETWARVGDRHTLTVGWATFHLVSRGYDALDEKKDTVEYTTLDEFWDFVESKSITSKPLYLFAHNVAFDARIVDFVTALAARGFEANQTFLPDPNGPFKMTFRKKVEVVTKGKTKEHVKRIILMDSGNFFGKRALKDLGGILGFPKEDVDPTAARFNPKTCVKGTKAFKELSHYCRRDVDIVGKLIDYWVKFCKDNNLGPCAMTLAGQAFNAFRHRFMHTEIWIHNNEEVLALELAAMKGGMTDNFKRGLWKAPEGQKLHIADVKSMYPSKMVKEPVPVKLIAHLKGDKIGRDAAVGKLTGQGRVDWVESMIRGGYAVVAKVVINTDGALIDQDPRWKACVPHLWDSKLVYPVGKFVETVNTPELIVAIERGVVESVLEVAVYEQEVVFDEYVDFFFGKRAEYTKAGDKIMNELCKLFLNSLFGKFGQCTYKWTEHEPILGADMTMSHRDRDTGKIYHFRQIGQLCEMRSELKQPSENSFIAIAGHITSYARRYLREMVEVAGFDHVGYTDTDSLFLDEIGLDNLRAAGYVGGEDGAKLGELEDELQCDEMDLRTLKDYTCWENGSVKKKRTKGVRGDAEVGVVIDGEFVVDASGGSYRQDQFQGIAGSLREGLGEGVVIKKVIKTPTHSYNKGWVLEDGTVMPYEIREGVVLPNLYLQQVGV